MGFPQYRINRRTKVDVLVSFDEFAGAMHRIVLKFCGGSCKYIEELHSRNLHRKYLRSRYVHQITSSSELTSQIGGQFTPATDSGLEKVKTKIIYNSVTHRIQSHSWKTAERLRMMQESVIRREKYLEMMNNVYPVAMKYLDDESVENECGTKSDALRRVEHLDPCHDSPMYYSDVDAKSEIFGNDDGALTNRDLPVSEPNNNALAVRRRDEIVVRKGPMKGEHVCGGCGAHIQCEDQYNPGFIPAEFLTSLNFNQIVSLLCQRCTFTRSLKIPLRVKFSADNFLKELKGLKNRRSLVLVVIDITDFPLDICADVSDLIGKGHPAIIVANKIDLLPPDSTKYINRIGKQLKKSFESNCDLNVKDVLLVSAASGLGMENLITKLFSTWRNYRDVYLVGYSNSGKSSVFNALRHSDFCKPNWPGKRPNATTSPWPGTTLGVPKFPIMYPHGDFLFQRTKRLQYEIMEKKLSKMENERRKQKSGFLASPGHFGVNNVNDINCEMGASVIGCTLAPNRGGNTTPPGPNLRLDDTSVRWCHDTPGIIHSDRVLDLLTTEEMKHINPGTEIFIPRTFNVRIGQSLFVGGLSRLDYVSGVGPVRVTVFCSNKIPMLVCLTTDANEVYSQLLGSTILGVPRGEPERLKHWPALLSKEVEVVGLGWKESCADIVISSVGWMAITPGKDMACSFCVHTPGGLGMGVRTPSILPHSVVQRGPRRKGSPAYPPLNPKRFASLMSN